MKKPLSITFLTLLFIGLSQTAGAQLASAQGLQSSTAANTLSNVSAYRKYLYTNFADLRASIQENAEALEGYRTLAREVRNYCASDAGSATCKKESLIVAVDGKLQSAIDSWKKAETLLAEIGKSRGTRQTGGEYIDFEVLHNIDRLNVKAKQDYQSANRKMVKFQEQNPLLFTSPSS